MTGASIANVVKISTAHFNPILFSSGHTLQIQTTLALFSAFALTLITTFLILYRLIKVTRKTNLPNRTQSTCKNIIDMIVQSSALYSMVLVIWAIAWAIRPASTLSGSLRQIPFNYLGKFIEEISFVVAVRCP